MEIECIKHLTLGLTIKFDEQETEKKLVFFWCNIITGNMTLHINALYSLCQVFGATEYYQHTYFLRIVRVKAGDSARWSTELTLQYTKKGSTLNKDQTGTYHQHNRLFVSIKTLWDITIFTHMSGVKCSNWKIIDNHQL